MRILNTGNSNSVANLVENENPTSMQSVPINDDMLPNMDTDTLENLTPFNNMKGSYNNLFCDNLDDDTFDQNDTTIITTMSPVKSVMVTAPGTATTTNNNQMLENVYCNISPAMQTQTNGKTINDTTITTTANQSTTNHVVDTILRRMPSTDPNLHVYSNVSNASINECDPISNSLAKIGNTNDILTMDTIKGGHLNADNTHHLNNIESIINQSIKSSKMLSDNLNDLDLDDPLDPTLVTASIVNTPKTNSMSKILKTNDTIALNTTNNNKFNSSKKTKHSLSAASIAAAAAAAVNIDESHANVSKKLFNDTTTSMDMGDAENGNGSYLRSLHDTTMIDTALDLDSIEDANICIENIS